MNRRIWLLTQPSLILPRTKYALKPSIIRIEDNVHLFQSSNKKMTSIVYYEDYEDCVNIKHKVQWYDPMEHKERIKIFQELFVLEEHSI